jgi:hypothetical protein
MGKSNPIKETIETIDGYPYRLKIYKIVSSPYWWCRATFNDKRITRTTKETDKDKAVLFAKQFYDNLPLELRDKRCATKPSNNSGPKRIGSGLRFNILARDKFTCRYCGKSAPDVILHVDHIIPISKNGSNEECNLITACIDCNLGKYTKVIDG